MNKKNKNYWFTFFAGVTVTLFILPVLYALGVPTFDVGLGTLFGENSMLAASFSLLALLVILFWVVKNLKKVA